MTIKEFKALKKGDKISHVSSPAIISVIDSDLTENGFFHREDSSKGGWNTITESNCKYYRLAE